MVERSAVNRLVVGSSPTSGATEHFDLREVRGRGRRKHLRDRTRGLLWSWAFLRGTFRRTRRRSARAVECRAGTIHWREGVTESADPDRIVTTPHRRHAGVDIGTHSFFDAFVFLRDAAPPAKSLSMLADRSPAGRSCRKRLALRRHVDLPQARTAPSGHPVGLAVGCEAICPDRVMRRSRCVYSETVAWFSGKFQPTRISRFYRSSAYTSTSATPVAPLTSRQTTV